MPYYRGSSMMGDPGLFSGLLKIGGKLLRGVPGIGTALTIADLGSMAIKPAAGALSKLKLLKPPTMPGGIVPYDPLFAARQLTSRTKGLTMAVGLPEASRTTAVVFPSPSTILISLPSLS